jgi:chromosome segregation ATPase
LIKRNEEL